MADVHLLRSDAMPPALLADVRELLDQAFDGEFGEDDWQHALGGWHAVVTTGDAPEVVAHAAVVPRPMEVGAQQLRCGYVEAVATAPAVQGRGHGALAMAHLQQVLVREFEVGLLSTGVHGFYERLGWQRWRGPTHVRHPDGRRVRTPDEDDGIMGLRFGPSHAVPLTAPLTCDARRGDDW